MAQAGRRGRWEEKECGQALTGGLGLEGGFGEGFSAGLASSLLPAAQDGSLWLGSSSWVTATATA